VKTKVEPAAENEVQLSVEIPADAVKAAYERAVSKLRAGLELPGFRKGRVPRTMVVQHYGEELVREQALEDAIPQWGDMALREAGLYDDVVGTSDVSAEPLDETSDYSFSVHVQLMPKPELGQYKGLEVPQRTVEVTDEQVDAQVALLQERLATLKPVEDRPVELGDFVLMDVDSICEGTPIADAQVRDQVFQIGVTQLLPGFQEQLIGMSSGGQKTFDLTFPDDYQNPALAGKPAAFTVKAKEIKVKVVPALDDAFAADVSDFATLAELRADLRRRIEAVVAESARREFRLAAIDMAVANAKLSVPRSMIDREAHRMYHELEDDIRGKGISMETYLSVIEKTKQEAEDGMRPGAEHVLRQRLVLEAIAAAENFVVTDDELTAAIKHDAEVVGGDYLKMLADLRKSGRLEQVRDEVLVRKTIDFLADQSVPVEMTEQEAEEAEPAGAAAEAPEAPVAEADAAPVG
jgi:trigger factor